MPFTIESLRADLQRFQAEGQKAQVAVIQNQTAVSLIQSMIETLEAEAAAPSAEPEPAAPQED